MESLSNEHRLNFEPNGRSPTGIVKISNRPYNALIDTGSSITIIPKRLLNEIEGTLVPYASTADGMSGPIKIFSHILVDIEAFGYHVRQHECVVIEESAALGATRTDVLLGTDFFCKLPPMMFNFQKGQFQLVTSIETTQQLCAVNRPPRVEQKSRPFVAVMITPLEEPKRDLYSTDTPPDERSLGRGRHLLRPYNFNYFYRKCGTDGPIWVENVQNDVGCITPEDRTNPDETVTWKDQDEFPPPWVCVAIDEPHSPLQSPPQPPNWNGNHLKHSNSQPHLAQWNHS